MRCTLEGRSPGWRRPRDGGSVCIGELIVVFYLKDIFGHVQTEKMEKFLKEEGIFAARRREEGVDRRRFWEDVFCVSSVVFWVFDDFAITCNLPFGLFIPHFNIVDIIVVLVFLSNLVIMNIFSLEISALLNEQTHSIIFCLFHIHKLRVTFWCSRYGSSVGWRWRGRGRGRAAGPMAEEAFVCRRSGPTPKRCRITKVQEGKLYRVNAAVDSNVKFTVF